MKKKYHFDLKKNSNDFALLKTYEMFLFRLRINAELFCNYKKVPTMVSEKKYNVFSTHSLIIFVY